MPSETHDRLDAFTGADPTTDVRAVFSWSYHALSAGEARLFRLLGLHTALTADQLLDPTRDPITPAPLQPGVAPKQ